MKRMIDLGALSGHQESSAKGINDHGVVVGDSWPSGEDEASKAFLWTAHPRTMIDIGTLGGDWASATAISDTGLVVGAAQTKKGNGHAFLWRPKSAAMVDLGTLGGDSSIAFGVNDKGHVVGLSATSRGKYRAFLWRPRSGVMQKLASFGAGWSDVVAYDINATGQIVGGAANLGVLWQPSTDTTLDLGSLGGDRTLARGINDTGHAVGGSVTKLGRWRAFLFRPRTHSMVSLGTLGGASIAYAINENRWVVGTSGSAAFLWKPIRGEMLDLGTLDG